MMATIHPIELPEPDYAFIYAKLARHVAVADSLLTYNHVFEAAKELESAMQAIEMFEKRSATYTIKTND